MRQNILLQLLTFLKMGGKGAQTSGWLNQKKRENYRGLSEMEHGWEYIYKSKF